MGGYNVVAIEHGVSSAGSVWYMYVGSFNLLLLNVAESDMDCFMWKAVE